VTSALDPELIAEVLDVIREIATRVAFLADGRIVEQSPPADLFTSPRDERTQRFLRRITDAGRL
jgi:polar amino acid transport system ATP-binding protein